jgi:glycosyltransferase involved in cell wall biosynthesis
MHIGIAGPLATSDIEHLLDGDTQHLPREMKGATLLATLIAALLKAGHQVSAYTTDGSLQPHPDNHVIASGPRLKIHYVPLRRRGFRGDRGTRGRMLDFFALERRALAAAMRRDPPDIVHAHWSYEFALAAQDSGIPYLLTCHDAPWTILRIQSDLYRLGRLWMARQALARTQHATVVSPYLIDELKRMTQAELHVVPNPIPEQLFALGQPRTAPRPAPRLAMLLSDWSDRKNPKPAMLAMQNVRQRHPEASMHLFGSGYGPGEAAEQWVRQQGLGEAFVFHGWTAHAEAMRQLADMDLLVHPAIEESFGMTLGEAMALGLPVVAGRDSGAVPWVLGGNDGGGQLVDVRSSEEIAAGILALLDDAERYASCSRRGLHLASERFAPDAVARAYVERYQQALFGKSSIAKAA